jgi:hypothetical protein
VLLGAALAVEPPVPDAVPPAPVLPHEDKSGAAQASIPPVVADALTRIRQRRQQLQSRMEALVSATEPQAGAPAQASAAVVPPPTAMAPVAGDATAAFAIVRQAVFAMRGIDTDIAKWEQGLAPSLRSQTPEGVLARAEAFGVERQFRRRLQQSLALASQQLSSWVIVEIQALQAEADWLDRLDADLSKPMPVPEPASAAQALPVRGGLSLRSIEYYEVKEDADLQHISGLPEVYGDPRLWQALYDANRDRVPDLQTKVPRGTVLLVPPPAVPRQIGF